MCNKQLFFLQEVHCMNKKFLSLALVFVASVSVSVFGSENKDDKKAEVPAVVFPEHVTKMQEGIADDVTQANKDITELEKEIAKLKEQKSKLDKDEDSKDIDNDIEKRTKDLVVAQNKLADYIAIEKAINTQADVAYNKSLLNKVAIPARKIALLIANNNKVALALEITGVTALSYVIYKSFFAQEEDEEDSL